MSVCGVCVLCVWFVWCVCVCVCACRRLGAFGVSTASPRNIGIYMSLFERNFNNLKMAAIGRNM